VVIKMNDFNFFNKLFNQGTTIHQRKKKFTLKEIDQDGLFEKTEATYLDGEGPKTEEHLTIYQAGCGHYVGFYGPQELIARCSKCGKHLCHRCGNLRCRRCLAILCDSCSKVVDGLSVYCSKCRVAYYSKRFSLLSLKGLHQLLSKEIR